MSTMEIVLILFVYLLFFGAKGIPSLAQTLGKAVYQFRNAAKDVQEEILQGANEIKKQAADLKLDQLDIDSVDRPSKQVPRKPIVPVSSPPTQESPAPEDPGTSSAPQS